MRSGQYMYEFVLKLYGYIAMFFFNFSKRDNSCDFLFASLDIETLPKGVYS